MSLSHANTLGEDSGDLDSTQSALSYLFGLLGSYYVTYVTSKPNKYIIFPGSLKSLGTE